MKISIETTNNGYLVTIDQSLNKDGRHVFRSVDIMPMLEFVGTIINDKKVEVKER